MKKEIKSFEEALSRLDEIVADMEKGKLTLDSSLEAFSEGIALIRFCNEKLDSAEQRVKLLLAGEDGNLTEAPFSPMSEG